MSRHGPDRTRELEEILEELSFQLTTARTVGLQRPDDLRGVLKRMRDLVADAEMLTTTVAAEKKTAE